MASNNNQASVSSSCLLCGKGELQYVRRYRTNSSYGKEVFHKSTLAVCRHCGFVQAVSRPPFDVLADYYVQDYRQGCICTGGGDVADISEYPKDNLYYYNRGQSIAELLHDYVRKEAPRILDVGAGYGHILYALGQQFPDSERVAIEYSEICVPFLESLKIQVHTRPVEEALADNRKPFDLVVLSHVLEHLLDPVPVLKLIREHLAPGGVLYIEVPNIPSSSLLKYPDHVWAPRFDEPHITFFSQETLRKMLKATGFEVAFCDTAGGEYKHISWLRFHLPHWRWFLQTLIPAPLFNFLRRQRVTNSLRVQDREERFYQYGGFRIWLRSISRKPEEPSA